MLPAILPAMSAFPSARFLLLLVCLGGCAHAPEPQAAPCLAAVKAEIPVSADYRLPGPVAVSVTRGRMEQKSGRPLPYELYTPGPARCDALVVLGHGFLRNKERMAGLARHAASWGMPVAAPDFRHSRAWSGNHDKNAADMVALARHLGARRVVYAGFSAGGLSALLAAAADPAAIGVLGLDLVDDGSGAMAAAALSIPVHGLVSAPSSCNASGNGLKVFAAAPGSRVLLVAGASHCHFEFPMDDLCGMVCGKEATGFHRTGIQETILGLAAASLAWQTGAEPEARSWWTPHGKRLEPLVKSGRVADAGMPRQGTRVTGPTSGPAGP